MQTIIMTIKPVHLGNIRRGVKEYEVRKNAPLIPAPFKVLLCESGSGGQIKAEFTCDSVLIAGQVTSDLAKKCCLQMSEIKEYIGNGSAYCWHISDMIDYCSMKGYRVRNISELGLKRPPQSWQYVRREDGKRA